MLSCRVLDDIKLTIPRPKIDGSELFKLLNKQREYFEYYLPWLKLTKVVDDGFHDENLYSLLKTDL